jgi:Haem-NO-binding
MYGLVNRALQSLVIEKLGRDSWREICEKAQIEDYDFVNFMLYPDSVTYQIAEVAAQKMNLTLDQALEAFGEYWILYTVDEGYGDLINICGSSFVEFLSNINSLHSRIRLLHPSISPPKIICSDIQKNSLRLHYFSNREGLAPMVVGLLKGLAKRFDTSVEIKLAQAKVDGHGHDEFEVKFSCP